WLPLGNEDAPLRLFVDDREARIELKGTRHLAGITGSAIRRAMVPPPPKEVLLPPAAREARATARNPAIAAKYADAWLFIDRDTEAEDSAEPLYRYVREHRPDINAFFVLRRSSHDWDRFAGEDHRRIAFSEADHVVALLNASHVLSSHLDEYIWGFL